MLVLLAALVAARARRRTNSDDLATNERVMQELAIFFNESLAAQKKAGDQALRALRETTDYFRVFLRRNPLHKIPPDYRYEKMAREIRFKIFQIRFYLKVLAEDLVPFQQLKKDFDKEVRRLRKTLDEIREAKRKAK